ncbi:6-pyruvoyl trahydropterin synthase family protein [Aegicerativicinus sediminis]|uniref:6-pyruvoyl trahydropterin synthase family protein n=1 Tax=Aegicerativicinus sediminis TaxID=2893202 RepID=UPI001E4BD7F4|nr:6-carboxytetrahydropterin synthase [Aegicerativicinus sediminis]
MDNKVTVSRKAHFNAAHRLFKPEWSDEKNLEVFGKCSNPKYHGHNYDLVVSVTGTVDSETGFVLNLKKLKDIIYREIEEAFDHKNLNLETEEFKSLNPTTENIAIVIYNRLRPHIKADQELEIILYETERNFVKYSG